jgi:hypothetical protein
MQYLVKFSWNPEFWEIFDIFPFNLNLLEKSAILETPTVFFEGVETLNREEYREFYNFLDSYGNWASRG